MVISIGTPARCVLFEYPLTILLDAATDLVPVGSNMRVAAGLDANFASQPVALSLQKGKPAASPCLDESFHRRASEWTLSGPLSRAAAM